MKGVIIGSGAMGSLFGGLLAQVCSVTFCDVWQAHVDAINKRGLVMSRGEEQRIVHARATSDAAELEPVDFAIVFVKRHQTEAAIKKFETCIGPQTVVLTFQNGIGNAETIAGIVPGVELAYGLTSLTSDLKGPGHIEMTFRGLGDTYLRPYGGKVSEKLIQVVELMNRAGIHTEITDDVDYHIWRKLTINASMNPLCSICRLTVGGLMRNDYGRELVRRVVHEVADVALAKGIPLSRDAAMRYLEKVVSSAEDHVPSMVIDVINGRKTEIDCLNEAVVAEGRACGVPTPYNDAISRIIRVIEQTYDRQLPRPAEPFAGKRAQ